MASLIKRERTYQVVIHHDRHRFKVPGFGADSIGKGLSATLGENVGKLLDAKAGGTIPKALREYVEGLPVHIRESMAAQGIIDPAAEGKPLAAHIEDYIGTLTAAGRDGVYIANTRAALLALHGVKMLGGVTVSTLRAHLAERRKEKPKLDAAGNPAKDAAGKPIMRRGIGATRHNAILDAWGGFFRWAVKERRAFDNPAVHIARLNKRTDKRHERRALSPDEARALLAAAVAGGEREGMAGAERALFYRTMLETGLRLSEIKSLTRGNVGVNALTLKAAYSKHRREDVLPIRAELAAALAEHGAHKAPAARLFNAPRNWWMLKAYKADLAAAGIAYKDADGKYADIHALRHTFISSLGAAGVNPKTMQALARHSSIALTMDKYTHLRLGDEARALEALPDYAQPAAAEMLRTGTDDAPAGRPAAMAPSRPIATLAGGMGERSTGGADAGNRTVGGLALGAAETPGGSDHMDIPEIRGANRGAQPVHCPLTRGASGQDEYLSGETKTPVFIGQTRMNTGGKAAAMKEPANPSTLVSTSI